MIRKLLEENKYEIISLLQEDSILNCYLIGDVENTGFNNPNVTFYGEYIEGELQTVYMAYHRYGMIYSKGVNLDINLIDVIKKSKVSYLSGGEKTISRYSDFFTDNGYRNMTLAILEQKTIEKPVIEYKVLSNENDMGELYDLLVTFDEFNVKDQTKEDFILEKLELNEFGTTYAIYDNGKIVATASTISETSTNAVINGVATKVEYRNKGLASKLVDQIIYDYNVLKRKALILYYDNPEAASIYKRKGFIDYGVWSSITINQG